MGLKEKRGVTGSVYHGLAPEATDQPPPPGLTTVAGSPFPGLPAAASPGMPGACFWFPGLPAAPSRGSAAGLLRVPRPARPSFVADSRFSPLAVWSSLALFTSAVKKITL